MFEFLFLRRSKQNLLFNYNMFIELYGLFVFYYLPDQNLLISIYFPGF